MRKLNQHISILLLLLILFPLVEKVKHEQEHLDTEHCGVKDKHFCKVEHSCDICDYVFGSSTGPAKDQEQLVLFSHAIEQLVLFHTDPIPADLKRSVFLRGPPVQA